MRQRDEDSFLSGEGLLLLLLLLLPPPPPPPPPPPQLLMSQELSLTAVAAPRPSYPKQLQQFSY